MLTIETQRRVLTWKGEGADIMGKLNVTPRGRSSGKSPGHARQPSCTTSAMHLPIHENRASASCIFSCSPIGQDFSKCRWTRESSTSWPLSSGFPGDVEFSKEFSARSRSSINPTLKFVPPLDRRQVGKCLLTSKYSHINCEVSNTKVRSRAHNFYKTCQFLK